VLNSKLTDGRKKEKIVSDFKVRLVDFFPPHSNQYSTSKYLL